MKPLKAIKVFVGGQRMKDIYPHATRWQVIKYKITMFLRKLAIACLLLFAGFGTFIAGSYMLPTTVAKEIIKEVPAPEVIPPVLIRIAKCESVTGHYDATGQVSVQGNTNGSVDIGKYQINERVWGKKATELKLNLFLEGDNEAMALWIYRNKGTEDWRYSRGCWSN